MINVVTKLGDIATEFKIPLLAAGHYGWYFHNTNKASAVQPNVDSITSWVGYDHSVVYRRVVRFEITISDPSNPMHSLWLSSDSSLQILNIYDDMVINFTSYDDKNNINGTAQLIFRVATHAGNSANIIFYSGGIYDTVNRIEITSFSTIGGVLVPGVKPCTGFPGAEYWGAGIIVVPPPRSGL